MVENFLKHISQLCKVNQSKFLLGVSGGIDSMVMLDLFVKNSFITGIAHCNFQLRNTESDDDAAFVKKTAENYNIPFHSINFNTAEFASKNHISVQMAARELRFEWFEQIRKENDYNYIALAHNLDDKTETFFINLIRGTGLKGITGIKETNENIIRPLLSFTRKQINNYALQNNIPYREDSSNLSLKYQRNKIRHKIIPLFKEEEPSFIEIMGENMKRFEKAWDVFDKAITESKKGIVFEKEGIVYIEINQLVNHPFSGTLAFEIFTTYNFSPPVINNILKSAGHQPGLVFYSYTHRCVKDRKFFLVSTIKDRDKSKKFYIDEGIEYLDYPIKLEFKYLNDIKEYKIIKDAGMAQIDFDKVIFPLILRKWQPGDFFQPLGMQGIKKISDFFTDNKFSLIDKENTWILASGEKIIWIAGHRIDDRFKVSSLSKNILVINKI